MGEGEMDGFQALWWAERFSRKNEVSVRYETPLLIAFPFKVGCICIFQMLGTLPCMPKHSMIGVLCCQCIVMSFFCC